MTGDELAAELGESQAVMQSAMLAAIAVSGKTHIDLVRKVIEMVPADGFENEGWRCIHIETMGPAYLRQYIAKWSGR
jgi:hypothetical protein